MRFALYTLLICGLTLPSGAVVVGQIDDFENGTVLGWQHGSAASPLPPINVGSGGPGGDDDSYLLIRTDGEESGSASRLVANNQDQWRGDFLSAGVRFIRLDARNLSSVDLVIRLGFRGTTAATFVTTGVTLPPDGEWTSVVFSLAESEMAYASGSYADCFGDVARVRIVHNPFTPEGDGGEPVRDAVGAVIPGQVGIDNIAALPVPEPGAIVMLSVFVAIRRLRRRTGRCGG